MLLFIVVFGSVVFFAVDDPKTADINEGLYTLFSFVFGCLISILSGIHRYENSYHRQFKNGSSGAKFTRKRISASFKNSGAVMGFALVSLAVLGFVLDLSIYAPFFTYIGCFCENSAAYSAKKCNRRKFVFLPIQNQR